MDTLAARPLAETSAPRRGGGAATIYDTLRDEIIALTLTPGTVLSRHELQERFGLSATPIRDALLKLQIEGLVDIFPQHATVVSPIDLERARQAQFLRRSVELELVRSLALQPDKAPITRLRSLIRQKETLAELQEYEAFNAADQAFHRTLYEAMGVGELYDLIKRQGAHIDRLRRLNLPVTGKMSAIIAEHGAIADAIAAGQPEAAQEALRFHLSRSLQFVDTLKERFPQYFSRPG
ncbi:MAG: GntR family transcriptional regulator [Proteobacteria bacterium]|nr:GntR family transcriptional regulator [Pseudomonadota bacterium]